MTLWSEGKRTAVGDLEIIWARVQQLFLESCLSQSHHAIRHAAVPME
jgi:hypothetical protein